MNPLVIIAILVVVGVIAAIKFLPLPIPKANPSLPYVRVPLLSPAELSFLRVLEQAIGSNHVLIKVRLGDVIEVKGVTGGAWQSAFNKIQSKHIDFLVCDPNYSVICAIELDDSSHDRPDRKDRDEFLDKALWTAGIKLVRVTTSKSYSVEEISSAIALVSQPGSPSLEATPLPEPPTCSCGALMVRRTAKSGPKAGKTFWGCPNYPRCRVMVDV